MLTSFSNSAAIPLVLEQLEQVSLRLQSSSHPALIARRNLISSESKSTSLHLSAINSLTLNPVEHARKTIV
jgi:hypothetical protein